MPYTNAYHGPGDREPVGLAARIDAELRARIEDAVDYACLDTMVAARRAQNARPPVADDPADREEFMARVAAFLERLRIEIARGLDDEQRRRLGASIAASPAGDVPAAIAVQVALAKTLPDYWQRFDAVRRNEERPGSPGTPPSAGGLKGAVSGPPTPSGRRERRGLLDRLLGRD